MEKLMQLEALCKNLVETNRDIEGMNSQPMTEKLAKCLSDAIDYRDMLEDDIKRLAKTIPLPGKLVGVVVVSDGRNNIINLN